MQGKNLTGDLFGLDSLAGVPENREAALTLMTHAEIRRETDQKVLALPNLHLSD
jgi:hypothetical protein